MKRFRRALGLTLMEVLVAVTILAVTASLVYLVGRKVRWMSVERICTSRMMKLSEALMVYRAQWGNVEADVGDGRYLGLPHDILSAWHALKVPGAPNFFDFFYCPLPEGDLFPYGYNAREKREPGFRDFITFSEATEVMRGATPVIVDVAHNPPTDTLEDPNVPHRLLWVSLDGSVHAETLVGMGCVFFGSRFCPLHAWVKWYDEEAWKRLLSRRLRNER